MERKFKSVVALLLLVAFMLPGCSTTKRNVVTAENLVGQLRDFALDERGIPVIPEEPTHSEDKLKQYSIMRGLYLTCAISEGDAVDEVALVCNFSRSGDAAYANGFYMAALLTLLIDNQSAVEYVEEELDFDHFWTGYDYQRTCEYGGNTYSLSFDNNAWLFVVNLG